MQYRSCNNQIAIFCPRLCEFVSKFFRKPRPRVTEYAGGAAFWELVPNGTSIRYATDHCFVFNQNTRWLSKIFSFHLFHTFTLLIFLIFSLILWSLSTSPLFSLPSLPTWITAFNSFINLFSHKSSRFQHSPLSINFFASFPDFNKEQGGCSCILLIYGMRNQWGRTCLLSTWKHFTCSPRCGVVK